MMQSTRKRKSLFQRAWKTLCKHVAGRSSVVIERLGSEYGGWTICPDHISPDSFIFSAGVGEDVTFDSALIDRYHCRIVAFDPTPRVQDWLKTHSPPEKFIYYNLGFADYDGQAVFYPPENPDFVSHTLLERSETADHAITVEVRKLSTLMKITGCEHIDILKMDIEGTEYSVINDMLTEHIHPKQVLVEFHDFQPNVPLLYTIQATVQLLKNGYRLFNLSPNGREYSFIYKGNNQ